MKCERKFFPYIVDDRINPRDEKFEDLVSLAGRVLFGPDDMVIVVKPERKPRRHFSSFQAKRIKEDEPNKLPRHLADVLSSMLFAREIDVLLKV